MHYELCTMNYALPLPLLPFDNKTKKTSFLFCIVLTYSYLCRRNDKRYAMALNEYKPQKLYYSIKEVAKMFELNESTLRYWETEFPMLKPKTSGPAKVRQYQEKDIDTIRLIHNLVKVRGFKLAAAKKMINANPDGSERTAEVLSRLIGVRDELQALKKQLDYLQ